jgi:hypothetical protein
MKTSFDHELLSSFYLWCEDRLVYFAEAYEPAVNHTFEYIDSLDVPADYNGYYSPYRQFVSSSDKFNVNDFINVEGTNINDKDGIYIDYNSGRVLVDTNDVRFGTSTALNITGEFAYKTVNLYITDETEESVILNSDFIISPTNQTYLQTNGGFSEKIYTVPAMFITLENSENVPFAMGGMDCTKFYMRAVVVADSNYTLDGVLSIFRDSARTSFPLIDYEDFPYGEFSHIKLHPYKYMDLASASSKSIFIDDSKSSKLTDRSREKITSSKDYKIGFLDFTLSIPRIPRAIFSR